jgi:thiamine-phosphate pyrophosphorylase
MSASTLFYYITDRKSFAGDEPTQHRRVLDKIEEAASQGVDCIQLREKDLPIRELETLAREAMKIVGRLRSANPELRTALLINSRTDVALASGAHGVHLTSDDISPADVRAAWTSGAASTGRGNLTSTPIVAVSCHSPEEVAQAAENRASFAVFAPVFGKKDSSETVPTGLDALRHACRASIPVLALGGITPKNARACMQAGAAGLAAIRLFQENDIATIVRELRGTGHAS